MFYHLPMYKYRDLNLRRDLIFDLRKRLSMGGDFEVWQPPKEEGEERHSFHVRLSALSPINSTLSFRGYYEEMTLDPTRPLYFMSSDKECVFKGSLLGFEEQYFWADFPENIKVREFRAFPRKDYALKDRVEIVFNYVNNEGVQERAQAPVLNASEGGICLFLGRETLKKLQNAVAIIFPELEKFTSHQTIAGANIKHLRVAQKSKLSLEEHLAVGFEYTENF